MVSDPLPPAQAAVEQELLVSLGKAMTVSGESIDEIGYRLEAIAEARGVTGLSILVLPSALMIQTAHGADTRVKLETFDSKQARLDQVSDLYGVINRVDDPGVDAAEAISDLERIMKSKPSFGPVVRTLGLGVLTVGFSLLLQPTPGGALMAFLLGIFVGLLRLVHLRRLEAVFPVLCTFAVAAIVFEVSKHITTDNPVRNILPALVTMLPGAVLTTGMRNLSAREFVSGASLLVYGIVTLMLLGFGIAAAATMVGVPKTHLVDTPVYRLGPWAPWVALVLIALGTHFHDCAPRKAMPWIMLTLVAAYTAQIFGALAFSPVLSPFFGAFVTAPIALWIERLKSGPPSLVTFLPAFWLLIPGAAGLIGVTEMIGIDSSLGAPDLVAALGAIVAISLGVLMGTAAFRAGREGLHEAVKTLPPELQPRRLVRRVRR